MWNELRECALCGAAFMDAGKHQRFHDDLDAWIQLIEHELDAEHPPAPARARPYPLGVLTPSPAGLRSEVERLGHSPTKGADMLKDSKVTANVPAADLQRARSFYADTLGLEPAQEHPGGLIYTTGGGTSFFLYETEFAGQAGHTIAQIHVDDVAKEVEELQGARRHLRPLRHART